MDRETPPEPAQQPTTPPAAPPSPGRRRRMACLTLAVVILGGGLAVIVLPLMIERIRYGPPGPPTRTVVVPALPPEWTPTPEPLIGPTQTPTQEPTPDPALGLDPATVALQRMWAQNFRGAVESWGEAIQHNPQDPEAYYGRAISSLWLTQELASRSAFVSASGSALADIDRAIALSPEPIGDHYLARAWAYENLGVAEYYRIDHDRLIEAALENLQVGLALPHSRPLADYDAVRLLLRLGRCDEALQEAERLDSERGGGLALSPQLTYYKGAALLCDGRYQQALDALTAAGSLYFDCDYSYQQAVALYFLDRAEEALRKVNALNAGCLANAGHGYYLSALMQYELGQPEAAISTLERGASNTWQWWGLKAYVEARILEDAGQHDEAIERMQLAELTYQPIRGPFLERIRRELTALGGSPVERTAESWPEIAPTPELPADHAIPPPVVRALHDGTTGALEIGPGESVLLHFRGPAGFTISSVRVLHVYLLPPENAGQPAFEMQLYDPNKQWWEDFTPTWNRNVIAAPDRFFYGSGDLFIRLHNPGRQITPIGDVGLELTVIDDFGVHVTWTFRGG